MLLNIPSTFEKLLGMSCNLLVMRMNFGNGGWVVVHDLGLPGPVYVRLRERDGRFRVTELYLDTAPAPDGAISNRDLGSVDLTRIEALANQYADHLRDREGGPSPDLSVLASYYATSFVRVEKQVKEGNWVVASFASQQLPEGIDKDTTEGGVALMRVKRKPKEWRNIRENDDYRLPRGPVDGLTDDFLREVARAYAAAVARGERPNVAIAEQVDYPPRTVQRWVYTARQRGIMPRGAKGRAG